MDNSDINRWAGKSTEYVLSKSFHELRNPIVRLVGYLSVLKSPGLMDEQIRYFIDDALNCSLSAKEIVESVYQYMNEQRKDQ